MARTHMAQPAPSEGIVPIVVTPFDESDQIDYPSLERILEEYGRSDVNGLVVPIVNESRVMTRAVREAQAKSINSPKKHA